MNDPSHNVTQIEIALKDSSGGAGKLNDLILRARDQIRKQQVKIVLADEWQHLTESGSVRIDKAADMVKQLSKATNVPIVMTCMPTATLIVEKNAARGITPHRKTIDAFSYGTVAPRTAFRTFLMRADRRFRLPHWPAWLTQRPQKNS
jgi:hypothetical protein